MKILGAILCLLLAGAASAETKPRWHVATSDHFIIYSQEAPASLRAYAEKLERYDALLRKSQATISRIALPRDRVTIFSLPTAKAVQRITGVNGLGGVYMTNVRGSMALTSRSDVSDPHSLLTEVVLLHEYTHHFMFLNFPASYPSWFVEGYAEFWSHVGFEDNGDVSVGLQDTERASLLNWSTTMPLENMVEDKSPSSGALEAKGWLLTHYLTFEPARKGQLAKFLAELNAGKTPLDAARDAFGDLHALDRELYNYVNRPTLPYLKVRGAALQPGPVVMSEIGPGEAAMMEVRMHSQLGETGFRARQNAAQARGIADRYPNDPVVQCILAEAENDAGNPDQADAAADRILAVDQKSVCGLVSKGRAAIARAVDAKAPPDAGAWINARDWFARANHVEPENPWPMSLYYDSYRVAHASPTGNAIVALLAAQDRAPQDSELRRNAAAELLRAGRLDEARTMLMPLLDQHVRNVSLRSLSARIGQDDPKSLADELQNVPPKAAKK